MKKIMLGFCVIVAIALLGIANLYSRSDSTLEKAGAVLNEIYTTSNTTIDILENTNDYILKINKTYGKYFTEDGLNNAIGNRVFSFIDTLSNQLNIKISADERIELAETNNHNEYSYVTYVNVKSADKTEQVIKCSGIIRFIEQNGKLLIDYIMFDNDTQSKLTSAVL